MTINILQRFIQAALLFSFLLIPSFISAECLKTNEVSAPSNTLLFSEKHDDTVKKPGIFKKVRMLRELKNYLKSNASGLEDERPSGLAVAALVLFLAFIFFFFSIFVGWGQAFYLSLGSLLASGLVSIIALLEAKNKKSRRMARTVLILTLVLILAILIIVPRIRFA